MRSCAPPLDLNSMYLYFLVVSHFSETSAVADIDGSVVGFTSAYVLPDKKDRLFVWQVAVHSQERCKGVAGAMIDDILLRPACHGVRYIEATVTPSNGSSRRLFERIAEKRGTKCEEGVFLGQEQFNGTDHEPEMLLTVGPFQR